MRSTPHLTTTSAFASLRAYALLLCALTTGACTEKTSAPSGAPVAVAPDALVPVVTDDATTLLFSFLDEQGRMVSAGSTRAVPAQVRSRVLVVDLSKTAEERRAHEVAFFTDLTAKDESGRYPVSTVSRYDAAKGERATVHLAPLPAGAVVVYSAVWCGYCQKAKAWLHEKGVPFVERDVEKMPGASDELQEKLKAAGVQGGGIPVIDWKGTLVMGFDKARLETLARGPVEAATGETP
jgi:glutaredoxin